MPNCLIKHWIQDRAVSVLHAVITPYRWRMILYHCERCPSASSTDNTAGLCANKIQLRTTVPICIFPGCEQGIYPAACWHQHGGKGVLGSCWPTVWPGLTGTARAHSDLIKLDSLSWGTFTSRYIQFFQINPACKGGFVLKVLPLILLPIRRSTAKQKGKRCLSHLCPFCCFLSAACTLLLGSYFLRSAFRNRLETLWKCITALQAFLQCTGLQTQRPTAGRARQ